ncbi:hypothetical protein OHC33_009156 [Knufia fluminis]|uniref:Ribonuclease n=1 Tax=Knufia fluminis TaxID=191047 RepID=A0AAN8EFU8_9EURO|nr:hypothetical protein OHC33_009156 [Knufia fluminis]
MSQSQDTSTQPVATEYIPPSVSSHFPDLHTGNSYAHYSPIPTNITPNTPSNRGTPVILGVDEAGRGPVIGPMIYGVAYLPIELQHSLLAETHHFDDSKVLTPLVRARLMRTLCTPTTDLHSNVGWAIKSLSAQDISAGMLKFGGSYNLNAQAMDATIEIIRGVISQGVNVAEIFVDTIGRPDVYQRRLAAVFPTCRVVVEKKADSLFPVVSAASVVAKVSRDVSCEVLWRGIREGRQVGEAGAMDVDGLAEDEEEAGWGSGYPSDARCVTWLKGNVDEMFGYGAECRFSWGTVKDLLEDKNRTMQVDWAEDDKEHNKLSQYFGGGVMGAKTEEQELRSWFGSGVKEVF